MLADILSRANNTTVEGPNVPRHSPAHNIVAVISEGSALDIKLIELASKASEDQEYQDLIAALVEKSWPHQLNPQHPANKYKWQWKNFSVSQVPNGRLILYQTSRVLIPSTVKDQFLQDLHHPHPTEQQMQRSAAFYAYWLNMESDISEVAEVL